MFKKLKECKTLKEIYTTLGTEPFENVAFVLLLAWCLLPFCSAIEHFYWGIVGVNDLQKEYAIMEGYKLFMQFVGSMSLLFAIFYLLGGVVMNRGKILSKIKREPWHFLLLLMLLWSCISTLLSDDIATSFHGTGYRFDGLKSYFFYAGAYVCAFVVMKGNQRKRILNVFALVANVIAVILILQDAGVDFITQGFLDIRAAVFFHFNHTGYYFSMSIICVMGLYLYESKRVWQVVYLVSMILQVYALLVNSTFGGLVGISGALVMMLVFFIRSQGKWDWKMLTPVLVVFLVCVASYMGYVPTSSGEDMKYNVEMIKENIMMLMDDSEAATDIEIKSDGVGHGRVALWIQGLKMIPERPIFGYGPEQLHEELAKDMWLDRSDNEFIQYAVFFGCAGSCLLFGGTYPALYASMEAYEAVRYCSSGSGRLCYSIFGISYVWKYHVLHNTLFLYVFSNCIRTSEKLVLIFAKICVMIFMNHKMIIFLRNSFLF